MKKTRFHICSAVFLALLFTLFTPSTRGTSVTTPAQEAAEGLQDAVTDFLRSNYGVFPGSWTELEKFNLSQENISEKPGERSFLFSSLDSTLRSRVEDEFMFLFPSPVPWISRTGTRNKIVLLTDQIIREDRRATDGRYAITVDEMNSVHLEWISENELRDAFGQALLRLPTNRVFIQPETIIVDSAFVWISVVLAMVVLLLILYSSARGL